MKDTMLMYVIFDSVAKKYGDVLALNNDFEAKRLFIKNCANCGFADDLELFCIGEISVTDADVIRPFISCAELRLICNGFDLKDEIEEEVKKNAENIAIHNAVNKVYSDSNFVENVTKLCRYFSKKDKRFGK